MEVAIRLLFVSSLMFLISAVKNNAEVDDQDEVGWTALHYAVQVSQSECVCCSVFFLFWLINDAVLL